MIGRPTGAKASPARRSTPPKGRKRSDSLAFHLLRTTGLTLASIVVAALLIAAALRIAAADHADPWDVVLIESEGVLSEAVPVVAGVLAAWATLGALVVGLVLLCTIGPRVREWLRPKPEGTTGGGERP